MLARKCVGFELTQVQLLDINWGLSFSHSLDIVQDDLKGVGLGSFLYYTSSRHLPSQDNILVDKLGCARLGDFGFASIAGLNRTETSASRFEGPRRWKAPELFNIGTEGMSGLSTRESDIAALRWSRLR